MRTNLVSACVLCLAALLSWGGCEADELTTVTEGTVTLPGVTNPVTVTLYGRLTDTDGAPVADATVRAGDRMTQTDPEGLWRLVDARVSGTAGTVVFAHAGYVTGSRTLYAREGKTYEVDVELLSRASPYRVPAAAGGTVEIGGTGARIEFPAAAFARADGSAVTGEVAVVAHYLDAGEESTYRRMPGDLRGAPADSGAVVALTSYGMLAVELRDATGAAVVLADGKRATLRVPIPVEARATAPARMPLWYYDEARALWVEDGFAERRGDNYIGEVAHFTFWNFDIAAPVVRLCGRIAFADSLGTPQTTPLRLYIGSATWGSRGGYVDATGEFCGFVPAGERLVLTAYGGGCPQPIYSMAVGPLSNDETLADIMVAPMVARLVTVIGQASCNGVIVEAGAARITQPGTFQNTVLLDAGGRFAATIVTCGTDSITVEVIDHGSASTSGGVKYALTDTVDVGVIDACVQPFTDFFRLTIDGQTATAPPLEAYFLGGIDATFAVNGRYVRGGDSLVLFLYAVDLLPPQDVGNDTLSYVGNRIGLSGRLGGIRADATNRQYDLVGQDIRVIEAFDAANPTAPAHFVIGPWAATFTDSTGARVSHTLEFEFRGRIR